jgi:hypothetical protein
MNLCSKSSILVQSGLMLSGAVDNSYAYTSVVASDRRPYKMDLILHVRISLDSERMEITYFILNHSNIDQSLELCNVDY